MDIIDILLAKAMTPEGQAESAAAQAQSAVREVTALKNEVSELVGDLADADIQATTLTQSSTAQANTVNIKVTSKDGTQTVNLKNYKAAGENEDGSMTQKAIKHYVDTSIGEAAGTNLGSENAGNIVIVGDNGAISPGTLNEPSLIRTQILTGTYQAKDALGLEIDYANKTFTRIQNAARLTPGADFDKYPMYGGITRCLVDDNGRIIAFYGDDTYQDNYTTGYQTMVYIPKFYYMRLPLTTSGDRVTKEVLMVSDLKQPGFSVHPAFFNDDGEEVDYILYSAYEGSTFDTSANQYNRFDSAINFNEDKIASIVEAKPMSGKECDLTITNAEKIANNRGYGWHITSLKAESALQLLMAIEYGTLNVQAAIGLGISNLPSASTYNGASYTGSTSGLGNSTGVAPQTINEVNGTESTYNQAGYVACSYRGIENLWGNIWRFVNGIQIHVDTNGESIPHILHNGEYVNTQIILPATSGWVGKFGYYNSVFDWAFIPAESNTGNSALPVGDYVWVPTVPLINTGMVMGGQWSGGEYNGIFYYGFDRAIAYSSRAYSARAMFLPKKNNGYNANVREWKEKFGGD